MWLQVAGILGIITGPIGIGIIIYATVQKSALRRRIADAGGNPDKFRQNAHWAFGQKATPAAIFSGVLSLLFVLLVIGGTFVYNESQHEDAQPQYGSGSMSQQVPEVVNPASPNPDIVNPISPNNEPILLLASYATERHGLVHFPASQRIYSPTGYSTNISRGRS